MDHERRKILQVGATYHNNPLWIRNQFTSAFPGECEYEYLVCENDVMYSSALKKTLSEDFRLVIKHTAKASPWQTGHVERTIGSIKREHLDHVVVLSDTHLRTL